jgi:hypothetical protein
VPSLDPVTVARRPGPCRLSARDSTRSLRSRATDSRAACPQTCPQAPFRSLNSTYLQGESEYRYRDSNPLATRRNPRDKCVHIPVHILPPNTRIISVQAGSQLSTRGIIIRVSGVRVPPPASIVAVHERPCTYALSGDRIMRIEQAKVDPGVRGSSHLAAGRPLALVFRRPRNLPTSSELTVVSTFVSTSEVLEGRLLGCEVLASSRRRSSSVC